MSRLHPLVTLAFTVLIAFVLAMLVIVPTIRPPVADIQQLFLFMVGTGFVTVSIAYLLYRRRLLQHFLSLRAVFFTIIVLTVMLIFVNVWVTARLMYISEHDLVLTTGLLIFGGVIAVVSSLFVATSLREQIHHLSKGVGALARGDWSVRLPLSGSDELARLAGMFNEMAQNLQKLEEQKRQLEQTRRDLIAWVSHDLRTPLAAVRAMNEAMIDGVVADPLTVKRYQQNIESEIQHLTHLIDDLFELAQLDTGRVTLNKQNIWLHDLVSDTLSRMSARAASQQVNLSATVDPQVGMVLVAPEKIERVLYNLLDNALQHTPAGGAIRLNAVRINGRPEVSVHNTGSYISTADLPHIFESFYRGEQSRAMSDSGRRGTGLGLAIVRGFVEAHGGNIRVESQPDAGTIFTFTLAA